jgi:hypothetical protein
MSRKITQEAVQSFLDRKSFSLSNTRVETDELSTSLFLFNNKIAILTVAGTILISLGGHSFTRTTQERLNGIPGINVSKSKGQVLLNGLKWDGEFVAVKINQ